MGKKKPEATQHDARSQVSGMVGASNGVSPTVRLTDEERRRQQQEAMRRVLDSFLEGDPEEQGETWESLKKALDEDRPSYRKLFP